MWKGMRNSIWLGLREYFLGDEKEELLDFDKKFVWTI